LASVPEALRRDFAGLIRRAAGMGYLGVEPTISSLPIGARGAAALFEAYVLRCPCIHAPLPIDDQADRVFEVATALGTTRLVTGLGRRAALPES
jgi:hypothetical protein